MAKQITVKPGETLWGIAERELGAGSRWQKLGYTGKPETLQPGTVLTIPTETPTPITAPPQTEIEKLKAEIEKTKATLEEVTGTALKAQKWLELYPGAKPTEKIPEWVFTAKTPEEVAALVKPERIKELEKLAFAPPPKTWEEIYSEAYKTAGLEDVKKKITNLDTQIQTKKDQLYSEEAEINENPWLSEAGRVGNVKKLYDMAKKEISNLIEQRKTLTDEYNTGIKSAGDVADRALKGWETQTKLYKSELDYLTKTEKREQVVSYSELAKINKLLPADKRLPYGTTKAEAMATGVVPVETVKNWTEFSAEDKKKLAAAGLNPEPTTSEKWLEGYNYLHPEEVKYEDIEPKARVALEALKGPEGFIDINAYRELRTEWIRLLAGKGGLFDDLYAATYLNPKDASIILKESETERLKRILYGK